MQRFTVTFLSYNSGDERGTSGNPGEGVPVSHPSDRRAGSALLPDTVVLRDSPIPVCDPDLSPSLW